MSDKHFLVDADDGKNYVCTLHKIEPTENNQAGQELFAKSDVKPHIIQMIENPTNPDDKTNFICVNCGLKVTNPEPIIAV